MANEFRHGLKPLQDEAISGALWFAGAAVRHGVFDAPGRLFRGNNPLPPGHDF
jgi:hypothetical protein